MCRWMLPWNHTIPVTSYTHQCMWQTDCDKSMLDHEKRMVTVNSMSVISRWHLWTACQETPHLSCVNTVTTQTRSRRHIICAWESGPWSHPGPEDLTQVCLQGQLDPGLNQHDNEGVGWVTLAKWFARDDVSHTHTLRTARTNISITVMSTDICSNTSLTYLFRKLYTITLKLAM